MTPTQKLHLLREMIRIRRIEQKCMKLVNGGHMGGWLVLSVGQESTAAAVRAIMGPNDIDWDLANAWEIDSLVAKLTEARNHALQKSRPTLLEVATYRHFGFNIADSNHKKYRTPEEIEFHKEYRDPIRHWADQLIAEGILTPGDEKEMHLTAKEEASAAADFAKGSPPPTPDDLLNHVYWETDNNTSASQQGRHFFNDEETKPTPGSP
ncbi:thiamine pyrophosphate-dependent enzyme [Verrucomicrobiaceae bacterium 227]